MFFETKGSIPEGFGFKAFGLTHLLWLALLVVSCGVAAYFYKRLDAKRRNIMRTALGCTIVAVELIRDIIIVLIGKWSGIGYLPLHLCGINILLIGFDVIKRTKVVQNFLYYFSIAGALLALLFPNWTMLPWWNFFSLNSFVIHILLVMYPFMLVAGGDIELDIKYMPRCLALLVAMAIPIYFINLASGENFMFLMSPEKGNPLELFEKLLGSHLWGFPILLPVVMLIMYLPIHIIKKRKSNKKETVTA